MFQVLFKDGGCRMSPRFCLFVSDLNQGIESSLNSKFCDVVPGIDRFCLGLPQAVKK